MSHSKVSAQVHRFGDAVAVNIGTGSTVYLTPADARKVSHAINKVVRSVEREKFAYSPSLTFRLEGVCGRNAKFERVTKS